MPALTSGLLPAVLTKVLNSGRETVHGIRCGCHARLWDCELVGADECVGRKDQRRILAELETEVRPPNDTSGLLHGDRCAAEAVGDREEVDCVGRTEGARAAHIGDELG